MKGKRWFRFYFCAALVLIYGALLPTVTFSAPQKPTVLKAVSWAAGQQTVQAMILFNKYIKTVNERAGGALKINYLGGPEIMPPGEQMRGLSKGVFDLLATPGYHASTIPEIDAPLVTDLTPLQQREVGFFQLLDDLHRKRLGVVPLAKLDHGLGYYLYSNVKVQKLSDLSGLKFRSNSNYGAFLKKLGIVTVDMRSGDIYTGMQRGLIVGYPQIPFIYFRGLHEVTRYAIDHPWWIGGHTYVYMNLNAWNNLSEDLQKLLVDVAKEIEGEVIPLGQKLLEEERERVTAAGVEYIKLTPPDGERLVEIASEVKWAELLQSSPEYGPQIKDMLMKK